MTKNDTFVSVPDSWKSVQEHLLTKGLNFPKIMDFNLEEIRHILGNQATQNECERIAAIIETVFRCNERVYPFTVAQFFRMVGLLIREDEIE